jgi:hypothetical protein
MRHLSVRRAAILMTLATAAFVTGGCGVPDTFSRVELGKSDQAAVTAALGADSERLAGGSRQEVHQPWPTVIRVTHVAVPDGGLAQWKLQFTGSVTHWMLFQSLAVDVAYEGPISQLLEEGLRVAKDEQKSEFADLLIRFAREKTVASLSAKWTDTATVGQDRYRSRLLGLLESSLMDLRGRGTLSRERFGASISAPGASLRLRSLGGGNYRLELTGGATLGPAPVL